MSEIFYAAFAEAKAKLTEELEREGYPPTAELLIAWGVGAGVRTAFSRLMPELGEAGEQLSRLKIEACYIKERRDYYINEAQRLALLVQSLGGNPEPSIQKGTGK